MSEHATQAHRAITVTTPLADDVLLFEHMSGVEELSRLFAYSVQLLSTEDDIKLEEVLGQPMTLSLELANDETRYFNGIVSRFTQLGSGDEYTSYSAELKPWLWILTRTSNCRIFQNMTVPEIVKKVFQDHGFNDFDEALVQPYRSWEYCVQYRETDFNFVSRLLEQEGIYYFFKHEQDRHVLTLCDSISAHEPFPGYEEIRYYAPSENRIEDMEVISDWSLAQEVQPGVYVLNDYDFKRPSADLLAKLSDPADHAQSGFEIYDYPGEYQQVEDGKNYVRSRFEELESNFERVRGGANARGLAPGGLFSLTDYPREDQNREYLITSVAYELQSNAYGTGATQSGPTYHCDFEAICSKKAFRAVRSTPKPIVQGPQTAVVVGRAGEEIDPDEHGRIKVQFHWDRYGKSDQNSSCWIRVAQSWAGPGWGAQFIPRIGQEVMVEFLEGDPDQPIVTGRVYNGENALPYSLPDNKTQSGIKSRSSPDGGTSNFNEIRLEDKKGSEEFFIQAEKDKTVNVKNDRSETVGHDETISIGNDRTESVGNDEQISIGNNRTENVGANETISIGANRTEDVGKNETISIGANRTEDVATNETISIGSNRTEDVGKDETITIGANRRETVGKKESVSIGDNREHDIGKDDSLNVGKNLLISAGDSITIKCGKASIAMKKDGTITVSGKDISLKSTGKTNIKASKEVIVKGSKVLAN